MHKYQKCLLQKARNCQRFKLKGISSLVSQLHNSLPILISLSLKDVCCVSQTSIHCLAVASSRSCLMMGNCQFSKHIISVSTVFDRVILLGSANLFTVVENVMVIITRYCIRNDLAVSIPGRKTQVKSLLTQSLASSLNLC